MLPSIVNCPRSQVRAAEEEEVVVVVFGLGTHFAAAYDQDALVADLPGEDQRPAALYLGVLVLLRHGGGWVVERRRMLRGDVGDKRAHAMASAKPSDDCTKEMTGTVAVRATPEVAQRPRVTRENQKSVVLRIEVSFLLLT